MDETGNSNDNFKILKSPFSLFIKIFFLLIFVSIFDIIISITMNFAELENNSNVIFSYGERFFLGSLLIQLIIVTYLFLKWSSEFYFFNRHELLRKNGMFFQKTQSFDIGNLDSISFHQTIFGKLFNYGNITLHFSNQIFILKQIPNPKHFTNKINFLKEEKIISTKE